MNADRLKVVMAEAVSVPARDAADALADAGHDVRACHEPGEVGLACAALRGRPCPLEDGTVDVVVLVRPADRRAATPIEQGALCGARRRIPLVVAGVTEGDPYAQWAIAERDGTDVVGLVEAVAQAPLPDHSQKATAAIVKSLRTQAAAFDWCYAAVRRRAGTLHVELNIAPEPSPAMRQTITTRVHQQLRAIDPWTPRMEISFPGLAGGHPAPG